MASLLALLGGLQKFKVVPLKKNVTDQVASYSLDTWNEVKAQFNPETLRMNKGNMWTFRPDIGDNSPEIFYGGGKAGTIDVDLIFDSTSTGNDVQDKYIKLYKLALVDPASNENEKGEPKQVLLMWGDKVLGEPMVISNIQQEYLFFSESGTPLRARVSICFKQAWGSKKGSQNPTSRSEARRTWIVEQGQRLDWIAYQEYGDTSAWRHIAETNGIIDPLSVRAGQILKLVPIT